MNVVERVIMAIEQMRVALKGYDLLDEAAKKAVRHQVYSRTGDFGKGVFKDIEQDECLAALYSRKEEELHMDPFVKDEVTIHVKDGVVISVSDLPPHMTFVVKED